jgi:hypothetical protein
MQRFALIAVTLMLILGGRQVCADEGMWTVDNFPSEQVRQAYDVNIDAAWLDKVRLATARLEGGCTGSFVSPNGLVLTNNHCMWS